MAAAILRRLELRAARLAIVAGALALATGGCDTRQPAQASVNTMMASIDSEPDARDLEIENLRAEISSLKAANPVKPPKSATPQPVGASRPALAMCFKDYCPCEGLQGGPDTVLCDQVEQGIDPGVEMMIAGKGMREARRQLATGDY